MLCSLRRRAAMLAVAALAAIHPGVAAAANLEELEPGKYILTGAIDERAERDVEGMSDGAQLTVLAWGHSEEAWAAVVRISQTLEARGATVNLEYAEDAAMAIFGKETKVTGKVIADSKIPAFDDTYRQRVATALERFDFMCNAKIPEDAPASTARALVGWRGDMPPSKGRRAMKNQQWYFTRTHDKGKWVCEDAEKVSKLVDRSRKDAERKEGTLRRTAEQRRKK